MILCHGFKGFWDWGGFTHFLDAAAARGYVAIGFSFSGSGVSQGDRVDEPERFEANTISREIADLADVIRALRRGAVLPPGRDPGPIALVGHSFGGGVAILAAADDPAIAAVVGWAAIGTADRFSPEEVAAWRRDGWLPVVNTRTGQELRIGTPFLDDIETNRGRLDIPAAAARLSAPLLLIHGDADTSVPLSQAHAIASRARADRSRLIVLPGAAHTFGTVHPFAGSTPDYDHVVSETLAWCDEYLASRT